MARRDPSSPPLEGGDTNDFEFARAAKKYVSISKLKAQDMSAVKDEDRAIVLGVNSIDDGGGGLFYYDADSSATEETNEVIAPDDGGGRWFRLTTFTDESESISELVANDGWYDDHQIQVNGFNNRGDGGGGTFYWDSSEDKANHDGATIINPDHNSTIGSSNWYDAGGDSTDTSGSGCWKRPVSHNSNGAVNLLWWGIVLHDSSESASNTTKLKKAASTNFDSFKLDERGKVWVDGGISFNDIDRFYAPRGCLFMNTSETVTIEFKNCTEASIWVNAEKNDNTWYDGTQSDNLGTDTTSVGVHILNCDDCSIHSNGVRKFRNGIRVRGDGTGCSYNSFYLGAIRENFKNLLFDDINSGWSNENKVFGGRYRISSGSGNATGSTLIELSGTNNTTFYSPTLEGNDHKITVNCGGRNNVFINPRIESIPANSFILDGDYNIVLGGYGNFGVDDSSTNAFDDKGNYNIVMSGRGMRLPVGDSSIGMPFQLQGLNGTSQILHETLDLNDNIKFRQDAAGRLYFYSGSGYDPANNKDKATILIDPVDGAIKFGSTGRDVTPIEAFRAWNATNFRMTGAMDMRDRYAEFAVNITDGDTTPDISEGNIFLCNNSSATTITDFENPLFGQGITIKCDGNTTIENNANIVTSSGSNITPSDNELVEFLSISDVWYQK